MSDKRDAARWRALIGCARIRVYGTAGYQDDSPARKETPNYRHFGGEFWTHHMTNLSDEGIDGKETLTGFADAILNEQREKRAAEAAAFNGLPEGDTVITGFDVVRVLEERQEWMNARQIAAKLNTTARSVATAARKQMSRGFIETHYLGGRCYYRAAIKRRYPNG